MAYEGVEIVDCMFVKLGKEAVGRGKRDLKHDLKRRRECRRCQGSHQGEEGTGYDHVD